MIKYIATKIFCLFCFSISGQCDSTKYTKSKAKYVVGFIPSRAKKIYGISLGLIGSETALCHDGYTQVSDGLNIQIFGEGFMQMFYIGHHPFVKAYKNNDDSTFKVLESQTFKVIHNGFLISPFGTFTDQINGISISGFMSLGVRMNGLSINALWNAYIEQNGIVIGLVNYTIYSRGIQIGLINKTVKLKGIQIGLWNKNDKRSLPLINWDF